jgi:hypothetical protein
MIMSGAAFVMALMANTSAVEPAMDPRKDPNKLICRREAKTGSLVQTTRTCKTRKEWAEISAASRRDVESLRENSSPLGLQLTLP